MDAFVDSMGVIVWTAALFGAIILYLALSPKFIKKLLGVFAAITAVGALLLYGYGYAQLEKDAAVAVFRAAFAVCKIFVGANAWGDIGGVFVHTGTKVVFWLLHLMGLFATAGAVVTSLGSGLLRWIRVWLRRWRDIAIIYGLNEDTLAFGRSLMEGKAPAVLFVDQGAKDQEFAAVRHMGAILHTDTQALEGTVRFLKRIGLRGGKRKLRVYALQSDILANQNYARKLLISLEKRGIKPQQTALTLLGPGDEVDNPFLNTDDGYGFGSVISINEPEMVARILMRQYPPCEKMTFDETGRATKDFHGLIIGFGDIGQAVMRQLVMNSQFCGSKFRLAVFSPSYMQKMGRLAHECAAMLAHYDIAFHPYDGRSCQLYDYLEENIGTLDYIAVCAGSTQINSQIGEQIREFVQRKGGRAAVYQCSHWGVSCRTQEKIHLHKIYTKDILSTDQIDAMAKVLNQSYTGKGDMEENWRKCGYFNRMSSRASADFAKALLRCAGISQEEAIAHWAPEGQLLENLAETEHLRWNAFHYCMGFRPMTEEEFALRAKEYRSRKQRDPKTDYRIARDMDQRIHACMIPWDALDAYSEKENAVTGEARHYSENDRNNVRDLGKLLRAAKK